MLSSDSGAVADARAIRATLAHAALYDWKTNPILNVLASANDD
jgi:hypothetical protein